MTSCVNAIDENDSIKNCVCVFNVQLGFVFLFHSVFVFAVLRNDMEKSWHGHTDYWKTGKAQVTFVHMEIYFKHHFNDRIT